MSDKKPLDGTALGRMTDQAVDLSEVRERKEADRQPPGWNATVRRMESAGGNIYTAADSLNIFPRAAEVLQDRVVSTLHQGIERRVNKALGPVGRRVVGKRRRAKLVTTLAGFAYGNGLTLLIVGVEAERERVSRRKGGHK